MSPRENLPMAAGCSRFSYRATRISLVLVPKLFFKIYHLAIAFDKKKSSLFYTPVIFYSEGLNNLKNPLKFLRGVKSVDISARVSEPKLLIEKVIRGKEL